MSSPPSSDPPMMNPVFVVDVGGSADGGDGSTASSSANKKDVRFDGKGENNMGRPQSMRSLLAAAGNTSGHGGGFGSEASVGSVTYGAQYTLPRLPIPTLEETLNKLSTVILPPLLNSDEDRAAADQAIQEFQSTVGPSLQQALIEYDEEGEASGEIGSYVEEFWNDSYLAPDASVVLNLNPFFVLEEGPDPKIAKDQLRRAASLCFASVKVASLLKSESLAPDNIKGKALCMDQFKVLFGSSRQPRADGNDDIHVYHDSTHVVVLCNHQFYYFPVLWPVSGTVAVDEGDILEILQAIERHARETEPDVASQEALGVFTSLPRSEWATVRQEMCKVSSVNSSALNVVDSALFILVLDDYVPDTIHSAAANMLHGTNQLAANDTLQIGSCLNRWYDKLQIIVCKDGTAGINFEHSAIDGHTALRFASDVFAETVISFAESIVDVIHGRGRITHVVEAKVDRAAVIAKDMDRPVLDVLPKKLMFEMSAFTRKHIYFAETALCDEITASDTYVLEFRDYGKQLIVGNKMSPDSYVQMSMLLAYYKLYGKAVCMYEPVLTKAFYHGRTEAMRSTTPRAKQLCQVWCDEESTHEDKLNALRTAVAEHSSLIKECAAGKGVDRHLFSLKCIAERSGMPVPPFFNSIAWKTLNHTVLSTSNCGNPALRLFGFGPVVPDGFGIGYIIKEHGLSFSVSSRHRQTQRYVRSLQTTLKEMHDVLPPQASMEVKSRRTTLSEVKNSFSRQSSFNDPEYPDIWGERTAPETDEDMAKHPKQPPSPRFGSKPFYTVVERHNSLDLLRQLGPQGKVNVMDELRFT